jgi:hypothetical protein
MITLETLPQATAQQVFDQIATHLLTQNYRCVDPSRSSLKCLYRGPNGLKCAAGAVIGDDEYDPKMETVGDWQDLSNERYVPKYHESLIVCLQDCHDNHPVDYWKERLTEIAVDFNLNTHVIS